MLVVFSWSSHFQLSFLLQNTRHRQRFHDFISLLSLKCTKKSQKKGVFCLGCSGRFSHVLVSLIRVINNIIPPWSYNLLNLIRRYVYMDPLPYTIIIPITIRIHFVCYHFPPSTWCWMNMQMLLWDAARNFVSNVKIYLRYLVFP